jgi:hypothetical protein
MHHGASLLAMDTLTYTMAVDTLTVTTEVDTLVVGGTKKTQILEDLRLL